MALREWKSDVCAALSVVGAMAGAGLASGREVASFFSVMGGDAHWGIMAAALGIVGFSIGLRGVARCLNAGTLPELARAMLGPAAGNAAGALHWLCCMLTAAVMLSAGGELMHLALDVRGAYVAGCAGMLLISLWLGRDGRRGCWSGGLLFLGLLAFGVTMALDRRPVEVEPYLTRALCPGGGAPTAVLLGLTYAALNVSLCGAALVQRRECHPVHTGVMLGLLMGLLVATLHLAIAGQPPGLVVRTLPCVLLAARWGRAGYWVCILLMSLAVATTLAAMLRAMQWRADDRRGMAVGALLALGLQSAGMVPLVGRGYPILGALCALLLLLLLGAGIRLRVGSRAAQNGGGMRFFGRGD